MSSPEKITVETRIHAPLAKVWEYFTGQDHITQWNYAIDDWHCPSAHSDLRPGGRFSYRMEARDGSFGFDFCGTFDAVQPPRHLAITLDDGRKVKLNFAEDGSETKVTETFEAEGVNPPEMQRTGWQAILENFRKYVESK